MSALSEFLEQKRSAWLSLQARPVEEVEPVPLAAHVAAEGRSGVRRLRIRDFQIVADSGANMAGHDLGPSSPESQLGVLASCLAHTFLIQAADREIVLDALDVTVTATMDARASLPGNEHLPRYPYDIRYVAVVESPADDETLADLQRQVETVCPILQLLRQPQTITGTVNHSPALGHSPTIGTSREPDLPEYLNEKGVKIRANRERLLCEGGSPHEITATASARGRSGVRRIRIREFQQLSDSGREFAGYDLGPTSPELQTGVLASCLTHVFLIQAATRGVVLEVLETRVVAQFDPRAGRPGHEGTPRQPHAISYVIDLASPATAEEIAELHAAVEASCPIYNLLLKPQQVSSTVENRVTAPVPA